MAAASMVSNPVAHSVQAATDPLLPFPSSHGANSLYLQRLVLKKASRTTLAPGLGLGLGLGLSSRNVLTQSKGSEWINYRSSLARALTDQVVVTEEEEGNPHGAVASVGVDDQVVVTEEEEGNPHGALASVDDQVLQEGNDATENEDSSLLGLDSTTSSRSNSGNSLGNNGATYHGSNGVAYHESNGVAHQGRNGVVYQASNGATSCGSNGAAYAGGNDASYSESNGTIFRDNIGAGNVVFASKDDSKALRGATTSVTHKDPSVAAIGPDATVENGSAATGTNGASASNMAGSLDVEFQTEKGGGSGTELQLLPSMSDVHQEQEFSAKSKVESIGQEDPWFKQAGREETPVSVGAGGRWNQFKTYSTIQRTCEIWFFVATFLFKAWLINQKFTYKGGITEEKKKEKRKVLAKWLKDGLLRLGPTFIKIGQQFSTRVDILAQEYVEQLAELQDQVPPFESETALKIVEEELGAPVGQIFDQFDPDPIAAASLGQVHRAVLRGEEVVVKVQRPGLKDLFDIDLKNLRVIAENLQKLDPKSDGAKRDWVAIYDECASVLYQEIDYNKEGANAERFADNFKNLEYVKVPKIFWECTTPQVLTMEYIPGIKINRIAALDQLGVDRQKLARYAVESYLEQILRHGFFHADPHPGNIAVDDENGGRLIFYDFGMMGSISPNIREGLLEAFYGVYEKDPDKVLQAMVQMGVLVPTGDMTAVRRTAQFFLSSFENRLAAQRAEKEAATTELGFKKPLSKEEKSEKRKLRLAAIGEDLLSISVDQPFRFPATFTFVVRAFSVLDGIGKGLDPRFDISEIAKPYALEILKFREFGYDVLIRDLKKRWNRQAQAFSNLFRQADRVEKLAEVIQRIEQGDLKLRVRTLESERAFKRVATVQQTIGQAILAGTLLNLATLLQLNAIRVPALAAFIGSALFGLKVLVGLLKVKKLDKQEKFILGTA